MVRRQMYSPVGSPQVEWHLSAEGAVSFSSLALGITNQLWLPNGYVVSEFLWLTTLGFVISFLDAYFACEK